MLKVKPWGKDQGDHVLIDDEDFDPSKHELYEEKNELRNEKEEEKGQAVRGRPRKN